MILTHTTDNLIDHVDGAADRSSGLSGAGTCNNPCSVFTAALCYRDSTINGGGGSATALLAAAVVVLCIYISTLTEWPRVTNIYITSIRIDV